MRMRRRAAVLVLLVVGLLGGGVPAATAQTDGSELGGAASMEIPPGAEAYLATLTPRERADFVATKLPATFTETVEAPVPMDAKARQSRLAMSDRSEAISPLSTGCWTGRVNGSAKALAGNTLYTYYHVGYWCSSGSTITAARVQAAGGETSTPGWRYEGVINRGAAIVSNQGRSYSQQKFVLGTGGWDIQSPTPCLRVNGLTSGSYTYSSTCGVY